METARLHSDLRTGRARGQTVRWVTAALLTVLALSCTSNAPEPIVAADAGTKHSSGDAATATTTGSAKTTKIDRSSLADVGTDPGLDYADPRFWLCRPGNDPDECAADLDATELLPDGSESVVKHVLAKTPEVDCFYVYPTVKLTSAGPMTDFSNIDITLDPLLSQGARFNEVCRVYAPLYRQLGVVPGMGGAPMVSDTTSFDLGLEDVRDAFKYYLSHLNKGRKFVLLGHSQGTGMLTAMMQMDVDTDDAVRGQMLSALLIGGGVGVPDGADVGGTFQNIPLCRQPGQLGCVIAYNSFSKEIPPTMGTTFARAPKDGQSNACTEPAQLAGREGQRYKGSYVRIARVNAALAPEGVDKLPADITTPFVVYRDVFRGECKNENGFSWLEISLEFPADDPRPPPPYRSTLIEKALGLHLMDYNLELDDLIEAVRLQIEAAK